MIRIGSSLLWRLNTSTHRRTDLQVLRARHDSHVDADQREPQIGADLAADVD